MNDKTVILSTHLGQSPDTLQFIKDRKFEEAWIISATDDRPSQNQINNYLTTDQFQTIIVEYIWNSQDNNKRFVLTVFLDDKCKLQEPKQFVDLNLDLFYSYPGFIKFVNTYDQLIVGHEYLFHFPIEAVNLGVFNHWLSVGPLDLWKNGEKYDRQVIENKIDARPDIKSTSLNYQGLFFRYNVTGSAPGPYYGIKTPCCTKVGENWVIDYDKVDYWMSRLIT